MFFLKLPLSKKVVFGFVFFPIFVFLSLIVYQFFYSPMLSDVFVKFPNGNIRKVSPDVDGVFYESNISKKGNRVVFFGAVNGPPKIWMADLKSKEVKSITPGKYSSRHPEFSSDGQLIVFSSDRAYGESFENIKSMTIEGVPPENAFTNIFTMDLNGKNIKQVTFGKFQDQRPTFSPDGKSIAFVSNRSGKLRIWMVDLENHYVEPWIVIRDRYAYRPNFSPDGKWLYFFVHAGPTRHQICRMLIGKQEFSCLENDNRGYSHGPFVTPDGKNVLMHSNRDGGWKIWRLPLTGGEPISIQPSGFRRSLHATMSENGSIAFDSFRKPEPLESLLKLKDNFLNRIK